MSYETTTMAIFYQKEIAMAIDSRVHIDEGDIVVL